MLKVLDLFSGIGGFSLGLERTGGFQTVAFCEIEPFCRRVLAKHWPNVRQYEDVRELTAERLATDGIAVDVITGGFPCQDISTAGKQAGMDKGTRSGLWSEIVRLARDLRPRFVIVENVSNLLSGPSERPGRWFGRVLGDLAEIGFDAEWHCIPASAVGAPHRRDRIWIVAYAHSIGRLGIGLGPDGHIWTAQSGAGHGCSDVADTNGPRLAVGELHAGICDRAKQPHAREDSSLGCQISNANSQSQDWASVSWRECGEWLPEPDVGRVADGIPQRVDRLRSLGNAIVPQIPEIIGRAILTAEAA